MRDRLALASLLACGLQVAAAADLRTLFHSAEERERLDRERRGEPAEPAQKKSGPALVTGMVKRSDGRDTVWVDGVAVTDAKARSLEATAKPGDGGRAERRGIEIRTSRPPQ